MFLFKTLLILCFLCNWNFAAVPRQNRLWIISFDGFRWDFLQKTNLENFQWMIDNGISAKWMEPVFITKTYPTHFSMATGLYEENHGIVGNTFYDSSFKEQFSVAKGSKDPKWWSRGEPMWITATNNNIRSAVSFWPGSEVPYNGVRPEHYLSYNGALCATSRIDQIIEWFLNGTRLVNMYYSQPDDKEHTFGPDSYEVTQELKSVDGILGYALHQLRANNLLETTNVIVVSDHGHEQIQNVVFLNNSVNPFDISLIKRVESEGILFSFELVDNLNVYDINKYLNDLQSYLGNNFRLYKSRDEIPDRWHYRWAADRIPNYNVLAEPGHGLLLNNPFKNANIKFGGDHGYDNVHSNMKPIFLAYGPDFQKKPRRVKEVHQVDLYGMSLRLLGLNDISPKNGSITRIKEIISHANVISNQVKNVFFYAWSLVVFLNFVLKFS